MQKRFILLWVLSTGLTGCAGLYEKQSPAPVYTGPAPVYRRPPLPMKPTPPAPIHEPEPVVKTTPLQEFKQPLTAIAPPPSPVPIPGAVPLLPEAQIPIAPGTEPQLGVPTPALTEPAPIPPPQTFVPTPFQPIEPPTSASPAVGALVIAANKNSQAGDLESAVATIERARSIEPNNASLYYRLALLRLKQAKPKMAEELAKKAALLASGDRPLKKHSWLLIAHAREMQKDFKGAKAAREKAAGF
ncbi:MAG: hypothetical protein ACU83V_00715 [Gammaproteobacteria bacterium]